MQMKSSSANPCAWILPVWYPEQVAQAPRDWGFSLPTRHAHLSTLKRESFGTSSCRSPVGARAPVCLPIDASLGSCGFVRLVLNLCVLLRLMPVCRYTRHWCEHLVTACIGNEVLASVFLAFCLFHKVGRANSPVLVLLFPLFLQASLSFSRW